MQTAIYRRLTGDAPLLDMATGGVHDQVPEGTPKPYVRIGDHLSTPDNDLTSYGREIVATLHVWTEARGNQQGQAIAARIVELLDHQAAALSVLLTGHRVVSIRCEFDQALPDPNPQVRHHIIRFRIKTAQEEAT
ncbi:DUF3168 domain-containing protein [Micromonospora sp. NPDC048999]|uniref:DUF3168 domain-containing protein n=1 Tax=Micromonospora sp. NPDC048999 TaxID=3155391 RepID=UPI0033FCB44C